MLSLNKFYPLVLKLPTKSTNLFPAAAKSRIVGTVERGVAGGSLLEKKITTSPPISDLFFFQPTDLPVILKTFTFVYGKGVVPKPKFPLPMWRSFPPVFPLALVYTQRRRTLDDPSIYQAGDERENLCCLHVFYMVVLKEHTANE